MTLVLGQDLRLGFLAAETVAERSLDGNLVKDGAIIQSDGKSVGDGTLGRVVVVLGELGVLDAADALAEVLKKRRGSGFGAVSIVAGSQAAKDEHSADHVLFFVSIW